MAKKSKEVQEMHARRWQIIYEVRDLLPLEESRKKYKKIKNDDVKRLSEELESLGDTADNQLQSEVLFLYFNI